MTVAEWDITPDLHEWIEGEIVKLEESAMAARRPCGSWEYDPCVREIRDLCNSGTIASIAWPGPGEFVAVNDPDSVLRRCAADRKILALHPYTQHPSKRGPDFYCDTCHVDDGCVTGGGNCDTVLALAEAYGLEPAGESDVEVVRA
ncbi:MAG: hypothetical protein HOZ81_32730 [Streptomyces sp.]|nr:hypothetical protein [Streptomyces sp.]NUS89442.1 hypothetical protein [Streptomyces sp.]